MSPGSLFSERGCQTGRRQGHGATSRRLLQTSVLVFPVVHGVVQKGLLLRRHALRLILVVEADHLRLRGRVGGSRLGAVANAVAEVDHET